MLCFADSKPASTTMGDKTPYRQIRASADTETIVVYQAYSDEIGKAAVQKQKLNASPSFKIGRMTWIKPSWNWMMYRSGFAGKDARQNCILAIRMKHEHFIALLEQAKLSHGNQQAEDAATKEGPKVVVQWDPERGPKLEKLAYRSIQIGIPGALVSKWVSEWIVSIEDVTAQATELKARIDAEPDVSEEELRKLGLLPEEQEFEVSQSLRSLLKMDADGQ